MRYWQHEVSIPEERFAFNGCQPGWKACSVELGARTWAELRVFPFIRMVCGKLGVRCFGNAWA